MYVPTSHWEGSQAAEGGGASWGHPLGQGGWGGCAQGGQTRELMGCLELAPTDTAQVEERTDYAFKH